MLTGKIRMTSGDAFINGISVRQDGNLAYKSVGYCPQFDALNGYLSGSEQLAFYARIKGVREADVKKVVRWALKYMELRAFAHTTTRSYSGGTKRKLSTAIALVGNPQVVLLDEPSTGMDPKTRRFMWHRIADVTRQGNTVLLTTHSMEECEALCSRVGIMVDGDFRCIGTILHLKKKFGDGYRLSVKMKTPDNIDGESTTLEQLLEQQRSRITARLRSLLPGCELLDQHYLSLNYKLPDESANQPNDTDAVPIFVGQPRSSGVAQAFSAVQILCAENLVEDYTLHQSSLDDVFVRFARIQSQGAAARDTYTGTNSGLDTSVPITDSAPVFSANPPLELPETPPRDTRETNGEVHSVKSEENGDATPVNGDVIVVQRRGHPAAPLDQGTTHF